MNLDDFIVGRLGGDDDETVAPTTAEQAALADAVDLHRELLAEHTTWADPPPELAATVVAAVVGEARADDELAGGHADTLDARLSASGVSGLAEHRSRRPRSATRAALWSGAAAGVAALVVLVALVVGSGTDPLPRQRIELLGTDTAPQATGTAEVHDTPSGLRIELSVVGLEPAGPAEHYQGWLAYDDGAMSLGTFHLREADDAIVLWGGHDLDGAVAITVTLERFPGSESSSPEPGRRSAGEAVLVGEIRVETDGRTDAGDGD